MNQLDEIKRATNLHSIKLISTAVLLGVATALACKSVVGAVKDYQLLSSRLVRRKK
jgi:hypothetical protein